jgi:hypothetical protein
MHKNNFRGPVAVADMKARLEAGWTVSELWDRMQVAVMGDGYSYDMAESLPSASNSERTAGVLVSE